MTGSASRPISSCLFLLALGVRSLPWPRVFGADRVVPHGNDAYYHLRRIFYGAEHFPDRLDFDAYVKLLVAERRPEAAVAERRRLGDLGEPEETAVERAGRALGPGRDRDLDMIETLDRHASSPTNARHRSSSSRLGMRSPSSRSSS